MRKQFSQRIFRISLSSGPSQLQVSSERLWLDGPATDPGFDSDCFASRFVSVKASGIWMDGRLMFQSFIQISFVRSFLDDLYQSRYYNVGENWKSGSSSQPSSRPFGAAM